jgi:thiol-disulfide isomerase/thioredoxin
MSYATDLPPLTHSLTAIKNAKPVPDLRLKNMDDETVDIKDLKGKVVVINFWATWCPPCRREMGSLERLHLVTKDKNVVIIAVNIGEDMDTVFSFTGTIDPAPTFPILFDPDAISMKQWNVRGLPATFIIHPNGTIAYQAVGGREFDHPDIQQLIISLSR